jgi:hypothetical protein
VAAVVKVDAEKAVAVAVGNSHLVMRHRKPEPISRPLLRVRSNLFLRLHLR